jgi:hypothetical protein
VKKRSAGPKQNHSAGSCIIIIRQTLYLMRCEMNRCEIVEVSGVELGHTGRNDCRILCEHGLGIV